MKHGLFITFEGPDGAGKTTQITAARNYLESRGFEVVLTREPGGTPIAERIRGVILDPSNEGMDPMCEALLYAASRSEHVAKTVRPTLEAGKVVISDRFVDSSYAYQGTGRELGDAVRAINAYATQGLMPDLTVLLLLDPEDGLKRINARIERGEETGKDRIERERIDFHRKVYEGYRALAEAEPDRIALLDANGGVGEIANAIRDRLNRLIAWKKETSQND